MVIFKVDRDPFFKGVASLTLKERQLTFFVENDWNCVLCALMETFFYGLEFQLVIDRFGQFVRFPDFGGFMARFQQKLTKCLLRTAFILDLPR